MTSSERPPAQLFCSQAMCKSEVPPPAALRWPILCPACTTSLYPRDVLDRFPSDELAPQRAVLMRIGSSGLVEALESDFQPRVVDVLMDAIEADVPAPAIPTVSLIDSLLDDAPPAQSSDAAPEAGMQAADAILGELEPKDPFADLFLAVRSSRREPADKTERVHWVLSAELDAYLVRQEGESLSMLAPSRLTEWGWTPKRAFTHALANVRARASDPFVPVRDGLYRSRFSDSSDSSLLLVPALFRELDLRGDPVAIVPTASHLFVAGAEDADALRELCAQALHAWQIESRVSLVPLRLTALGWQPLWSSTPEIEELRRVDAAT